MISKEEIDREERYISDGTNKTDRNELICFLSQYSIFLIFLINICYISFPIIRETKNVAH